MVWFYAEILKYLVTFSLASCELLFFSQPFQPCTIMANAPSEKKRCRNQVTKHDETTLDFAIKLNTMVQLFLPPKNQSLNQSRNLHPWKIVHPHTHTCTCPSQFLLPKPSNFLKSGGWQNTTILTFIFWDKRKTKKRFLFTVSILNNMEHFWSTLGQYV